LSILASAGCEALIGIHDTTNETVGSPDAAMEVAANADASGEGAVAGEGGPDATANAYRRAVLADAPVAYWRLEEAAGTVARDEIGAHPATYSVTGITYAVDGAMAGSIAVSLDGKTARIVITGAFAFAGAAPFSLEAWVKPSIVDANTRWITCRSPLAAPLPSEGYELYFGASDAGTYLLFDRMHNGARSGYASGSLLSPGSFTYLVGTYDGQQNRLFVDGNAAGAEATVAGLDTPDGGALVWGDTAEGQLNKFGGVLDELAIYDKALPQERIVAHFHAAGR
jgi:hypothetical protein